MNETESDGDAYGGENRQGAFVEVDEEDPFVGLQLRVLANDGSGFIASGIELSEPGRYELRKVDNETEISGTVSESRLGIDSLGFDIEKELRTQLKEVDGPADVSVKIEVTESE